MEKNAGIYIAGHKGLVGFSLMHKLQTKGYTNIITKTDPEIDLTRQTEVEDFFESKKPEYIFLPAAKSGGILANKTYKAQLAYDNIMIAANVINAAHQYGVKKLLNIGSSCIYPKFAQQPMREEYLLTGSLESATEPTAISKISAIKLCMYYNEQYGTNFISVTPTNLYGPNDDFDFETAYVLPALIRKFYLARLLRNKDSKEIRRDLQICPPCSGVDKKAVIEDEKSFKHVLKKLGITEDYVIIWGSGEAYREFLYADDFADACIFLMESYDYKDIGEFVNIGAGEDIKIKELAELIREIVGFEGKIRHDLSKPEGAPRKLFDISKMKSLNWKPATSFKEGIKKTYEWYTKNYTPFF